MCIRDRIRLLSLVQSIETLAGRQPSFRNGPRSLDIDILFYGDQVISLESPDLQIPHPRILERAFVLVPLLEIAPSLIHPTVGIEIQNLPTPYISETAIRKWGIPIDLENFLSRQ